MLASKWWRQEIMVVKKISSTTEIFGVSSTPIGLPSYPPACLLRRLISTYHVQGTIIGCRGEVCASST